MKVSYRCKFCRRPGEAIAETDGTINFDLGMWVKLLCCNRCGDFMARRRRFEERIKHLCIMLMECRSFKEKDRKEAEEKIKKGLTAASHGLHYATCDYYSVRMDWQGDFLNSFMERPNKFEKICSLYHATIREINPPKLAI